MKKITLFIALLFVSYTLSALDLPVDGEFYVIQNTVTNTYINGTGTGKDAVKHDGANVSKAYQVFKVSVDAGGYTFHQFQTKNQLRYDGNWSLYYAKTGNSSAWKLVDKGTHFNINRNGQSNGIGGDNKNWGHILYGDKNESATLPNKWVFDASRARTILTEQLMDSITAAQAVHDANSSAPGAANLQTAITHAQAVSVDEARTSAQVVAEFISLRTAVANINTAPSSITVAEEPLTTMSTSKGTPIDQIIHVSGSGLASTGIQITLEGADAALFSVSPTSLTVGNDGTLASTPITITYSGANEGNHTATLKLANDNVTKTLALSGATSPVTSVGKTDLSGVTIIRTITGIHVEFSGEATVELYGINGSLLEKTAANGAYTKALNNGIYILKINNKAYKVAL